MGYRRPEGQGQSERAGRIRRVLWLVLAANITVALAKLGWGIYTNSAAMQADGFHSLFDGTSNVIGLVGISIASRPADRHHPYGHSKFETYASAAIAGMLVFAAYRIGSTALSELLSGTPGVRVEAGSFLIMIGTLAINIFITVWERREGLRLKSEVLVADSSHTRSDVLVSLGVIASLVAVQMGYPRADSIVALFVAGAIVWTAWGVFKAANVTLSDEARIPAEEICSVVLAMPGVLGCHDVRSRGPESSVYVDLHVQVDESRTVADGHRIAEDVERMLVERFPQVADAIVHLEPYDEYQVAKTVQESDAGLS